LIEFLGVCAIPERRPPGQVEPAEAREKGSNGADFAAAYRRASPVLDGGYQMVATVLAGTLGGWWLDGKLGTTPWLMVAGAVLGIGGGMTVFFRAVLRMSKKK
jgi:ATP synthase protein I